MPKRLDTNGLTAAEAKRRGWIGDRADCHMGRSARDFCGGIDQIYFARYSSHSLAEGFRRGPLFAYMVQTTSASNCSDRMKKLRANEKVAALAAMGCAVLVWAWRPDGRLREENMTAELAALHKKRTTT